MHSLVVWDTQRLALMQQLLSADADDDDDDAGKQRSLTDLSTPAQLAFFLLLYLLFGVN